MGARPIGESTKTQDLSRLAASSPTPICQNAPLNTPDRATMFSGGEKGYIDYPTFKRQRQSRPQGRLFIVAGLPPDSSS